MLEKPEKKTASAPKARSKSNKVIFALTGFLIAILFATWATIIANRGDPGCAIKITDNNTHCLVLEPVSSSEELAKGLSGRESLPRDHGMLFTFDKFGQHCIWMKDMKFPIDIIWLDNDKKVVAVREGVRPETYPESFCPDQPAKYVIEVNSGVAQQAYVSEGSQLKF